ncbi:MAG: lipopolysaccharide transport periplasmic protein LptA [Betaproteobacteria bacterium]|nr:lipopolysaccharide transport periplasmic protein LptA [Betaproteobacteria bacterium]
MKNKNLMSNAVLAALLWTAACAWAEKADMAQPVYINAASLRLDDARKLTVYEGGVVLTRGSMQIDGDRIEIAQDAGGLNTGTAYGRPAQFRQKEEGTGHIIEGWAERIDYDGRTEIVKLTGQARLKRGNLQEMHSDSVVYDMRSQVYQARGGATPSAPGRVIAVIQSKTPASTGPAADKDPIPAPLPAKSAPAMPAASK